MPRCSITVALVLGLLLAQLSTAQTISIDGVPEFGQSGQITGTVADINPATHRVAAYLNIEGIGWWTKPTFGMPTVPINPNGTFNVNIGTGGLDEFASTYAVSLVPNGTIPPQIDGLSSLDLGTSSIVSDYEQRYGTNLNFAGRNWGVKEIPASAGPGGNFFSADSQDVWVDQNGLHLTIQNHGGQWVSTEVVLTETLGYGTYMFQTTSRQDILDANATFGAFTWDNFGDDTTKPDWPWREIDFEDSRWGDAGSPTNSQVVVQPYFTPGGIETFTLPDSTAQAELTRIFHWSPGKVEFFTLLGHHQPDDFPESAIVHHTVIEDNPGTGLSVPDSSRENFRFNLWLNDNSGPLSGQAQEVVINNFQYYTSAPITGDYNGDGLVDGEDYTSWQAAFGTIVMAGYGADGNGDGVVNAADYTVWRDQFEADSASVRVPEPSSLALVTAVLSCLVRRSRRVG